MFTLRQSLLTILSIATVDIFEIKVKAKCPRIATLNLNDKHFDAININRGTLG